MDDKEAIRERIWSLLEGERVARFPGARGRIPNFIGAEAAADRLSRQTEWAAAVAVKSNPDSPQLPVRIRALTEGKLLYMAVPKLVERQPFVMIDPRKLDVSPRKAASIKGAMAEGRAVGLRQMRHVDLIVCGTVAVNGEGARIGKGGGYSDIEYGLLTEAGLVDERTVIATTVHPLQVLDDELPQTEHDFRVDLIVTPDEVIRPRHSSWGRPKGIIWSHLPAEKIGSIPVLAEIRGK